MIEKKIKTIQQYSKGVDKIFVPLRLWNRFLNSLHNNFQFLSQMNETWYICRFWTGELIERSCETLQKCLRGCTKFLTPLKHQNILPIWLHNNPFNFHYNWMKLSTYVDFGLGNWLKRIMKPSSKKNNEILTKSLYLKKHNFFYHFYLIFVDFILKYW